MSAECVSRDVQAWDLGRSRAMLRELLDRSLAEILRQRAELVAGGAPPSQMIAIVLSASLSPDGWPQTIVVVGEAAAREHLRRVDHLLPLLAFDPRVSPGPFAIAVACHGGALVVEAAELG